MSNKVGRPSLYSQELADTICSLLAEGKSLRTICNDKTFPDKATVFRWIRTNEDFRNQYARAKQEATDALAEELLDISDNTELGEVRTVKETPDGIETTVRMIDMTEHRKLKIETRKWIMAKMKPKKYGDKIDVTSAGEKIETAPVIISQIKPRNADAERETTEGS